MRCFLFQVRSGWGGGAPHGVAPLVSLLLTLGADLVARDSHGNSVFHMLVWHSGRRVWGVLPSTSVPLFLLWEGGTADG